MEIEVRGRVFLLPVALTEPATVAQEGIYTATYASLQSRDFSLFCINVGFLFWWLSAFLFHLYFPLVFKDRKNNGKQSWIAAFAGRHRAEQHSLFVLRLLSVMLEVRLGQDSRGAVLPSLCLSSVNHIFPTNIKIASMKKSQWPFNLVAYLRKWSKLQIPGKIQKATTQEYNLTNLSVIQSKFKEEPWAHSEGLLMTNYFTILLFILLLSPLWVCLKIMSFCTADEMNMASWPNLTWDCPSMVIQEENMAMRVQTLINWPFWMGKGRGAPAWKGNEWWEVISPAEFL